MPMHFRLEPPRCIKSVLLALHLAVLLVLWLTELAGPVVLFLTLLILFSLYSCYLHRTDKFDSHSWNEFSCTKNQVVFFADDTVQFDGVVLPETVVTPYFILLCLRSETVRATYRRLICRDELNADEFRKLRILLRMS